MMYNDNRLNSRRNFEREFYCYRQFYYLMITKRAFNDSIFLGHYLMRLIAHKEKH